MVDTNLRLLVLGTGGCAHVLAGMMSSHRHVDVRVLTQSSGEAERWNSQMTEVGFDVVMRNWEAKKEKHFVSKPSRVSHDPSQVAPGCNMFIFTGPVSHHEMYFQAIKPYIDPGCIIVGMPGGCGFSFQAEGVLGEKLRKCFMINFDACPWTCHINSFGFGVAVTSMKESVLVSSLGGFTPGLLVKDPVKTLGQLLYEHPSLSLKGHILGDSLTNLDAILNPCIMYGQWCNWDGEPLDSAPLFYQGIDEIAAALATGIGDEAVNISKAITRLKPHIDLTRVLLVKDIYKSAHVIDGSNDVDIRSLVANDWDRAGIKHDMRHMETFELVPDFMCGHLTVDVPLGLVVMRGMADIVGVLTPYMDEIIKWAESKMGKEYIQFDKLLGRDVMETRCPQKYGLKTLDDIVNI
ncbi:opine dehydrogenase-like [Lineus longissimus]|uniref:opine dehydrogenase-like n=1 Tax=Lineus longissimus TaxID=88925 RepID=UPI00315DD652